MIGQVTRERIIENFVRHEKWRRGECLNMIASECALSPLASRMLDSDLEGRYDEHSGPERNYEGTEYSYEIEEMCNELFRKRFITRFADVRPLSGSMANLAVYNAVAKPGDVIATLGTADGGHVCNTRRGIAGVRGLKEVRMAFDQAEMNIDVERTVDIIRKSDPKVVVLGSSLFLFPHPVKEIREQLRDVKILYDAAHTFGLVYGGAFQQPLDEGADLMTACTNKTFQGPQGGLVIGNYKLDNADWERVQESVYPGVLGNTRLSRMHALAVTAMEMNQFGDMYANAVVRNAKALGRFMFNLGFKVLCPHKGFTESHQIVVDVSGNGGGDVAAREMARANVMCSKTALPSDDPLTAKHRPSGIRLGVQELTRRGMKEQDMQDVAEFFRRVIIDKERPESVKMDVAGYRENFSKVLFCYNPKSISELDDMLAK